MDQIENHWWQKWKSNRQCIYFSEIFQWNVRDGKCVFSTIFFNNRKSNYIILDVNTGCVSLINLHTWQRFPPHPLENPWSWLSFLSLALTRIYLKLLQFLSTTKGTSRNTFWFSLFGVWKTCNSGEFRSVHGVIIVSILLFPGRLIFTSGER